MVLNRFLIISLAVMCQRVEEASQYRETKVQGRSDGGHGPRAHGGDGGGGGDM